MKSILYFLLDLYINTHAYFHEDFYVAKIGICNTYTLGFLHFV